MAVVPQIDLLSLIGQFDGLNIRLERNQATIFSDDRTFTFAAPVVFLAGVGLKCFDLRRAGWEFMLDAEHGHYAAA